MLTANASRIIYRRSKTVNELRKSLVCCKNYSASGLSHNPDDRVHDASAALQNLRHDMQKFLSLMSTSSGLDTRYIPLVRKKETKPGFTQRHFKDHTILKVRGGNGGDGAVSMLSVYRKEFAGPDGGDGGNGGHVVLKATKAKNSLCHLPCSISGPNGECGRKHDCHGANAEHMVVEVPLGTIVSYEGKVLASLDVENALFVAARGGAGGKGNVFFCTDTDQAPKVAEYGGKGEQLTYEIELRTIADIGLIGFPNAGKSTLLRAISRARPKVANYPFTTLNPHVGIVHYADMFQLAVADIPGLVEGAHVNKGLGYEFLRHVQRCAGLLYILDGSQPEPWKQLEVLRRELDLYDSGLSQRPYAVVANKIDLDEAQQNVEELKQRVDLPVIGISAKRGDSVRHLLSLLRWLTERNPNKSVMTHDTWEE
ncbi:hypothetical protein HAZT_HAZT011158 [Hyalella azteca]|uniref:Mitochondrial ribosome-associated GTPase 2-like n=1 Tax=Hyalella azteca TaxID=294128 RepID=A0A6A0HDD5_HYAAZ|nr:mitochondrial ribosome-associated GTPase 2-like [Hyalella azteca]KAA0203261.1 hypothetical protein HAZT_HAZT011158 [Hyalella azteca]